MNVRLPAAVLLVASLMLPGCSLGSDGSDDKPTSVATSAHKPLPATAWIKAGADDVARGGTLRLATEAMPANFNPQHPDAANGNTDEILAPTIGSAVRLAADGSWSVDPDYAASVEVTGQDPLTVQVRLNPEAVWQGGTPITAQDMVAFWKAQNGSDKAFQVSSTDGYDDIASVEVGKDKFSYSVTFTTPNAEWPLYVYPRLPRNVSSSPQLFNNAFRTRAISSNGPFVVTSIDTARGIVTEKPNPRWWGATPRLSRITWRVATAELQAKAYVAGELDAVDLQADTYATAERTGVIQRAAGIEWTQLTLNGGRGPLADKNVRRAVAHAIDREAIAEQSASIFGAPPVTLGSLILVPGQKGYVDSSTAIAYEVAKAKALLAQAGYVRGADGIQVKDGTSLTLTMPVPSKTPANAARATAIKRDLAKIGIRVVLRTVPAATFFDAAIIPLDFDLVTFVRRGSAFPIGAAESMFYPVDAAQNFTGLGDARFGTGWKITTSTLDEALRLKRVSKLDEWLLDDVPVVPLAVTPVVMGVRKGLLNYGAAQFERPDWTIVGFAKK